jgi:sulfite reductase beta subunit-like hemoprotein
MDHVSAIPAPSETELQAEIDQFETTVLQFLQGDINPDVFKRFRLKQGIYGQRQADVQMVRIKIPLGDLSSEQTRTIARLSKQYATGTSHVTTRQDIQLHFVKLEQVAPLLRELAAVGLTTREACGNTVRNVTLCPLAGICPDELFDITPYAMATAQFFLRNPICEDLPRKFKFAFSGCAHDRAMTGIHDIGVMAVSTTNGSEALGFRLTVGGGLGPSPRRPYLLEEFVAPPDLLPTCEAVLRVFSRFGNRKNRSLARIKFLIEKIGFETFYRVYHEELTRIRQGRPPLLPDELRTIRPFPRAASVTLNTAGGSNGAGAPAHAPGFDAWRRHNVIAQRQPGLHAVQIRLIIGDIAAPALKVIADLADRFAHGRVRTTQHQNLLFRNVTAASLPALHATLAEQGLAHLGAEDLGDVISCPGTDTCGLGITASKGLGRVLTEQLRLNGETDPEIRKIAIKISGCPNSCAQHHIATIGFHGLAAKFDGRLLPAYQLHLGGRLTPQSVQFGLMFPLKFPAKRVPEVVQRLLTLYRTERQPAESFLAYVDRTGKARFQQELTPLTKPAGAEADGELFQDWGDTTEYTMADHGPGECAGAAVNFVAQHFEDSAYELEHAQVFLLKERPFDANTRADLALIAAVKALLTMDEIEPLSHEEAIREFEARFVSNGANGHLPSPLWSTVTEQRRRQLTAPLTLPDSQHYVAAVRQLVDACRAHYERVTGGPLAAVQTPVASPPHS